jgi:hypothetical protein
MPMEDSGDLKVKAAAIARDITAAFAGALQASTLNTASTQSLRMVWPKFIRRYTRPHSNRLLVNLAESHINGHMTQTRTTTICS